MYTLYQTINYTQTFIEYSPVTAGTNLEPAISIANMIKSTMLNAPLFWPWNRNEFVLSGATALVQGQQDYIFNVTDFAYLEKVSLLTADGSYGFELKDVYNTNILGIAATATGAQAQPNAAAIKYYTPGTSIAMRFLSNPDQAYTGSLTYQKIPTPFQGFAFESVVVVSGVAFYMFSVPQPNAASNGLAGQSIQVQGFDIAGNNGTFPVVSSTSSYVILTNASAVTDSVVSNPASGIIGYWSPIPDSFVDIYNNLFLAEVMALVDDGREQLYRQRGIGALLSKAEGLSDMDRNAFLMQWLSRGTSQQLAAQMRTTQGIQGRAV